jgi:type IV pilus assembly protein PilA
MVHLLYMQWAHKQKGFTIVELLIVVVVIAILAAITIVAYNGIQNRAKASAAQAAARQTGTKVALFASQNADTFPAETSFRTDLSLPSDTTQATYDYYASDDKKAFCLSVTNTTLNPASSYAYTSSSNGTVPGRCVKNLANNPSLEDGSATGWSTNWPAGSGINATASVPSNGGYAGNSYRRWVIGGANTTNGMAYIGVGNINVTPSSKVAVSYWVRSSEASSTIGIILNRFTDIDGGGTNDGVTANLTATTPANTWVRRSTTATLPSTTLSYRPAIRAVTNALVAGQTVDADAVMVVMADIDYAFYDGNSPNWAWTGTPNNSPSFGPALPY